MPEIGTSGSMSGDGKRSDCHRLKPPRPSSTLRVPRKGTDNQWRRNPPRQLSIGLVADERFGWATGWIEAS